MGWIVNQDQLQDAVVTEGQAVAASGVLVELEEGFGLLSLGTYLSDVTDDESDDDEDFLLTCDVELQETPSVQLGDLVEHLVSVSGIWRGDLLEVADVVDRGEVDIEARYQEMASEFLAVADVLEGAGLGDVHDAEDLDSGDEAVNQLLLTVFPEEDEDSALTAFGSWAEGEQPVTFVTVSHLNGDVAGALAQRDLTGVMLVTRVVPQATVEQLQMASVFLP